MICSENIRVDHSHSRHKLFSFVIYHMILSILNNHGVLIPEVTIVTFAMQSYLNGDDETNN